MVGVGLGEAYEFHHLLLLQLLGVHWLLASGAAEGAAHAAWECHC
jgi:hypothetical protein